MSDEPRPRPTLAHRLEFALLRWIERRVEARSMTTCARLGRRLGSLARHFSPRYRRLVRRNLRIATAAAPLGEAELDALVAETFRRGGANLLCSLKTAAMPADELAGHVEIRNGGVLDPHQEGGGTGLVVALAHMGNWECLVRMSTILGNPRPLGAVYRPLANPLMDAFTLGRRTADRTRLFSRKDGFQGPAKFLREGGAIGVLSDQRAGSGGVPMPFFGKLTTCPPLPDLLSRRAKSDVVTLAVRTIGDGRWEMRLGARRRMPGLAALMAELEGSMRTSLADVFWFHDRWRTDPVRPLSLYTRVEAETAARATVPLRVLLTTDPADPHCETQVLKHVLRSRPDSRIDLLSAEPMEPADPRIVVHAWDPGEPETHADALVRRIDASHPAPLDAALLFGGNAGLARAAKRLGVQAILGVEVSGKPWTNSFPRPASLEDWVRIIHGIAAYPTARKP